MVFEMSKIVYILLPTIALRAYVAAKQTNTWHLPNTAQIHHKVTFEIATLTEQAL